MNGSLLVRASGKSDNRKAENSNRVRVAICGAENLVTSASTGSFLA